MYICICEALTEKEIAQCIESGANSVMDVQRKCQAGQSCGSCLKKIQKMVRNGCTDSGHSKVGSFGGGDSRK